MGGVGGAGAGVGGGDFWSELSTTNSLIAQLQDQIGQVRQAHQASLTSTDPNARSYASELNDAAREKREETKNQIKKLYKLAKGDKAQKTQAEGVKTRFQSLLQEHQVIEKEFRKKVKDRAERQYRIVNPNATEEEVRQVTESDNPQIFSQALLNSNRYGDARNAYREVQERHAEIQKIERTLTELAQMFSEMAMLVEQQDETIVNVETQAQGVDTDIKAGYDQTSKAVDSARKARRKKWICFWICVLIIAILALVLGIYFGTKK
nr:syntaxin 1B/2/3 [Kwoniella dejecticola CBS 10117]OBR86736.1 syntaxin 1B/2/3 [Kwoniella dejecticola CBS 10117]